MSIRVVPVPVALALAVSMAGCGDNAPDPRVDAHGNLRAPGDGGEEFPPLGDPSDERDLDGEGEGEPPGPGVGEPGDGREGEAEGDGPDDREEGQGQDDGDCVVDLECPGDRICVDRKCVDPDAEPPAPGGGCRADGDCGEGQICQAATGKCEDGCRVDRHCPDGLSCIDGRCAPGPCRADGDCEDGQFCDRRDGVCREAECFADADCAQGGTCRLPAHTCEAPAACEDDAFEPNDAIGAARAVGPGEFADLVLCGADTDWFAVRVQVGEVLRAQVEHDPAGGQVTLTALTSDGDELAAAQEAGGIAALDVVAAASDDVRLRVRGDGGGPAGIGYRLAVEVVPAQGPACDGEDGLEDNDVAGAAAEVAPGLFEDLFACSGDADWYGVRAEAGDTLEATITFVHDDGDLDMFVFGPGGLDELGRSVGIDDAETVVAVVRASGIQLVEVVGYNGAEGGYTLEVHVIPGEGGGDVEPPVGGGEGEPGDGGGPGGCAGEDGLEDNDDLAGALPLAPGEHADLFICAGDADWYAVEVCGGGRLVAALDFLHADGDLDVRLHGPGGDVVDVSEGIVDGEQVEAVAPEAGTYAVEVYGFLNASNAYGLAVAVEGCDGDGGGDGGGVRDDALEENDDPGTAARLSEGPLGDLVAVPGDPDWYSVAVCAGGTVRVDAQYDANAGGLELQITDEAGAVLANGAGVGGVASVRAGVAGAGTLRLRVRAAQGGAAPVGYALDVAVEGCADGPRDDGFEDNDGRDGATELQPGVYEGLIVTPRDDDWYAVAVCAGAVVTARIDFLHADGDLDMTLVGSQGQVLASSLGVLDAEEVTAAVDAAGVVFVRVYGWRGAANGYDLTVAVDEAACEVELRDDPFEDNDAAGQAALLAPGRHDGLAVLSGDDDWYAVQACAGAVITADLEFVHADGDVDVTLQGPDGRILASGLSATDDEHVTAIAQAAGSYLLRVYGFRGAQNTYALTLTVDEAGCAQAPPDDALEDNDTREAASGPMAPGVYGDLRIEPGDDDWFAVAACAGAVVTATIDFAHADGDLDLALHGPDGAVLDASTGVLDSETVSTEGPVEAAATLYVRVYGWQRAGGAYTLTLGVDEGGCARPDADDAFEDNDDLPGAAGVAAGVYEDLRVVAGDDDWFAVAVCAGAVLEAEIAFAHADGDLDMGLLDGAGRIVDASTGVGDTEAVAVAAAAAGTYYVRVYGWQGAAGAYTLTIGVDEAGCREDGDDRFEDNDTWDTAVALAPPAGDPAGLYEGLTVLSGDDDWYAVPVCAQGAITVTISFVHADGDLDLALVDDQGAIVDFSDSVADFETVSAVANIDTTAYVRVYGFLGAENAYVLEVLVQGC